MAEEQEPGGFRAAIDALKDKARDAKEGIEEQGRKFKAGSLRFTWAIGIALAVCATLVAAVIWLLVAVYFLFRDGGADRGGAALASAGVAVLLAVAGWRFSRRLAR